MARRGRAGWCRSHARSRTVAVAADRRGHPSARGLFLRGVTCAEAGCTCARLSGRWRLARAIEQCGSRLRGTCGHVRGREHPHHAPRGGRLFFWGEWGRAAVGREACRRRCPGRPAVPRHGRQPGRGAPRAVAPIATCTCRAALSLSTGTCVDAVPGLPCLPDIFPGDTFVFMP